MNDMQDMEDMDVICGQLCQSIDVILDQNSGVLERSTANEFIERFKSNENVLLLLNISSKLLNESLIDSNKAIAYKHFGLQVLEVVIKFFWNSMQDNLKQEIKQLIQSWFHSAVTSEQIRVNEMRHLLNASSRCVIEVVFREWPQNWPQFMPYLLKTESNLSLYCIWRLSEEIGVFFKPNNSQRRREITNELNNNLNQIYSYIYRCLTSSDTDLCLTSLSTLAVMFEWTQLDTNLLNCLIQMLSNECLDTKWIQIKQSVCNCLIVCLDRKQLKTSDKTSIQSLLTDSNISLIVSTIRKCIEMKAEDSETQTFVKRLVLVFVSIGQKVVTLSNINDISVDVWTQCLQVMLILFSHQNIIFNSISVQFWYTFSKHYKQFSNNNSFDNSLQINLLTIIANKISRKECNKSVSGYDFDGDEDFESFFLKFRSETIELLRQMTYLNEKLCFDFVSDSINTSLIQSNNDLNVWEILAQLSSAVFNKIVDKNRFCVESNSILQSLIARSNKEDPNVISSQLSCVSALTVFLPNISNELLNEIIKRTLILASFSTAGQTKSNRSKEVKNLRRHSCSLFIKICQTYPSLLLPLFADLKSHIMSITSDVEQFSQMEKCSLNEGLILISNEFPDIELQKQFIGELLSSINWLMNYNINTNQFIEEIGLNLDSIDNYILGQKRANILYSVNLMLGLLKRVKTERRFALIPQMIGLFNGLFRLISNLNTIWRPEYQQKCYESYKCLVYANITEADKTQVLDMASNLVNAEHLASKSDAYRMQVFLWSLHENCFSVLGLATNALKPQIYDSIDDFKPIFNDLEYLPVWKLRIIVKNFVKPFVSNCSQSESHYQKVVPIISTLLPFLFNVVNNRWNVIKARNQSSEDGMSDECEPIESEVVCDQINRLLSRELIELLLSIISVNKIESNNDVLDKNISEFGNYLLNTVPNVIIYPSAKALTWMDTIISLKTAHLNDLLIRKIITDNMIRSEGAVYFLFEQLMMGLSYFGEHEQNQSILIHLVLILYEGVIRLGFTSINTRLSEISGSDVQQWTHFQIKLLKSYENKLNFTEKRKKEIIIKLLSQVIGKNIGQLYKYNSIEIKNLRPIFYSKTNSTNNTTPEDDICFLFNDS